MGQDSETETTSPEDRLQGIANMGYRQIEQANEFSPSVDRTTCQPARFL
jgi:hypothetical protein